MNTTDTKNRCSWCLGNDLYLDYHDNEWGVPQHDGLKLFAMLQLEGMQAGLSWLTILKRRETMTAAYCGFNPKKLLKMPLKKREALAENAGIIRHKLKINGVFKNAQAFMDHFDSPDAFSQWLWAHVDGAPQINQWHSEGENPAQTDTSTQMSKSLKKLGFTFVGPTICYAFMQATGMVWDHTIDCFREPTNI